MKSHNPKFYTTGDSGFVELYGTWAEYGYGVMLVYYAPRLCKYVQFTPEGSFIKKVIDRPLLDAYKRDVTEDNAQQSPESHKFQKKQEA